MPTVGRTDTSLNNSWNQNTGSNNQIGCRIVMPETGLITTLHVFVSGNGGTITGQLVLWDNLGNILAQTGNITFSSGSTGVNGQAWQVANLVTPYLASSGQNMFLGFWRAGANTANYSWHSGTGLIRPSVSGSVANTASPSALNLGSGTVGELSAYADYVVGGIKYSATPGTFNKYALRFWNGSSWQRNPLKRWSGTAWNWHA